MLGDNSVEELGLPGNSNELSSQRSQSCAGRGQIQFSFEVKSFFSFSFEEHHPFISGVSSFLSIAKKKQRVAT